MYPDEPTLEPSNDSLTLDETSAEGTQTAELETIELQTADLDDQHTPAEIIGISGVTESQHINDLPAQEDAKIMPIVGLGGSAGSIGALQEFFGRISTTLGIAYVVVVHLASDYESQLPQILQARTRMPVMQVQGSIRAEPDHVYVIPPAYHLTMMDGSIHLSSPQQERGKRVAVDLFFRTLAASHRSKAVAVVLSGVDGDGAIGIKRIKEHGGVTIAQDPEEAEYDGMPRSAIETGMVDWILSVEQMADKLGEWIDNERKIHLPAAQEPEASVHSTVSREDEDEVALHEVVAFLHTRTGHDFTHYKRATVVRRIMRRLQVNSLESIPQYVNFLRTHPGETGALLQDLLISVTNFFRDPEAFWALDTHIPHLFRGKSPSDTVRVWVSGCATGEEAYSLAMLLAEHAETLDSPPEVQIFASDLDDQALRFAREGIYPSTIAADVSPERLRRFFIFDQGRYRIKKEVRERVLFASHNLLKDSPFSRLDLISCRNLLIYFERKAQDQVLNIFHFALRPGGLLFLGGSESAGETAQFSTEDKKYRIYGRQDAARSPLPFLGLTLPTSPSLRLNEIPQLTQRAVQRAIAQAVAPQRVETPSLSYGELHLRLLERVAPPSILVNSSYEILHLSEGAGAFLRFVGGEVSTHLPTVVHPALRLELRTALFRAVQNGEDVDIPTLEVDLNGEKRRIRLQVRPLGEVEREAGHEREVSPFILIIFDEDKEVDTLVLPPSTHDEFAQRLEDELLHLRSYLRSSVEQFEASREELKASNEELQAMNEEQRSATEELETSREEIQAANEELTTVNQELKSKIEEVSRTNSDLQNLMASTDVATVFLNRELRIKRYTPRAIEMFHFIPNDVGRPLADLRHSFAESNLIEEADTVLRTLITQEREIQTEDGQWFLLRVSPYRTLEDQIDGVVLTFLNITERRAAEEAVKNARDELEWRVEERTRDLGEALQQLRAEATEREKSEAARTELLKRLVNSQEEERGRISRELHDNLGQHLTAVMLGLQNLQNQNDFDGQERRGMAEGFENLRNLVDVLMQAAHHQAWQLRPAELDDMGLEVALRHYISDWSERTALAVDFQAVGWENQRLSPDLEITFYRVVQEALTNVARHANASHVSVILEANEGISAIIEDDGNGFIEGEGSGRLGLLGMRERLALVGGSLEIESSPDNGTTLFARAPHAPDSPSDFPYSGANSSDMARDELNSDELDSK